MPEKNYYPYEPFLQTAVLDFLDKYENYGKIIIEQKSSHGHGVDIKVRHNEYSRYWFVEVKGGSTSKNADSVDTNQNTISHEANCNSWV